MRQGEDAAFAEAVRSVSAQVRPSLRALLRLVAVAPDQWMPMSPEAAEDLQTLLPGLEVELLGGQDDTDA
jgi:sarcosine oxidase gamma subunit